MNTVYEEYEEPPAYTKSSVRAFMVALKDLIYDSKGRVKPNIFSDHPGSLFSLEMADDYNLIEMHIHDNDKATPRRDGVGNIVAKPQDLLLSTLELWCTDVGRDGSRPFYDRVLAYMKLHGSKCVELKYDPKLAIRNGGDSPPEMVADPALSEQMVQRRATAHTRLEAVLTETNPKTKRSVTRKNTTITDENGNLREKWGKSVRDAEDAAWQDPGNAMIDISRLLLEHNDAFVNAVLAQAKKDARIRIETWKNESSPELARLLPEESNTDIARAPSPTAMARQLKALLNSDRTGEILVRILAARERDSAIEPGALKGRDGPRGSWRG